MDGVHPDGADKVLFVFPEARDFARGNRSFQQSAVRQLGPTHEIARTVQPSTRVLYVENDPVATAHTEPKPCWTPATR